MATWLKEAISEEKRDEAQKKIRDTVEKLIDDIDKRGDKAVRELSI
jgi:sulfopropanediol 3-dehydrogenase